MNSCHFAQISAKCVSHIEIETILFLVLFFRVGTEKYLHNKFAIFKQLFAVMIYLVRTEREYTRAIRDIEVCDSESDSQAN